MILPTSVKVPKKTQCEKILSYLRLSRSITQLEAVQYFGCYRLSARIADLRKSGHIITSERVKQKNRFGDDVWFSKYTLCDSGREY